MKPQLASKKTCTGCMACVDSCGVSALHSVWEKDGHLYVKCVEDKCVQCGKCEKACPIVSHYQYERTDSKSKPYAAWAKDDKIRLNSSSGGIFAAIAQYVLANGGYVVGAIIDGITVKHIITNKIEDLPKLQGSKYQQGDLTGIYREVKNKLKESHTILFSGTPCQVAALYSFLRGNIYDNLLTIDLVCSGFPSSLLLNSFSKYLDYTLKNISYRNKSNGWDRSVCLNIISTDENIHNYQLNNIVFNGFGSGYTNRFSCSKCPFTYMNRNSDLTLADFWGEKKYVEEHFKGVSCVIINSKVGEKIFFGADIEAYPTFWKDFLPYNPRLVFGKHFFLQYHPARRLLAWNFLHLPMFVLEKIYGKKIKKRDILWLPYKLFNFILYSILRIQTRYFINNELKANE